jgi:hypothetical protein
LSDARNFFCKTDYVRICRPLAELYRVVCNSESSEDVSNASAILRASLYDRKMIRSVFHYSCADRSSRLFRMSMLMHDARCKVSRQT